MLCEKCHRRQATVHTTTVVGDSATTVNLCAECSEGAAPDLAALLQTGCHYCGGAFHCTAPDLSAESPGEPMLWALCRQCAEEFYGFWNRRLPDLATGKVTPEQLSEVPALLAELDRHMKQWLSERGSQ